MISVWKWEEEGDKGREKWRGEEDEEKWTNKRGSWKFKKGLRVFMSILGATTNTKGVT